MTSFFFSLSHPEYDASFTLRKYIRIFLFGLEAAAFQLDETKKKKRNRTKSNGNSV